MRLKPKIDRGIFGDRKKRDKNQKLIYFWLSLSIIAAILYGISGLKLAFQSPYTIQDDARQYLFWMQQFQDISLLQNDLIADYFSSVSPIGYQSLYWLVSSLNIDIFAFNKISTLLIGVGTTIYCFLVCLEIFSIPFAGFVSSLLLNQNLWMVDDLSSGTPRAYIYILLLGFIYYLLRQDLVLCLLFVILQGIFYPQALLISAGVLTLRLLLARRWQTIELWGLFVAIIILAIYALQISDFSPVITASEAKTLPEFSATGRNAFFQDSFTAFWLTDRRSGFFSIEWQYTLMCSYGVALFWLRRYSDRFYLVKQIQPQIKVILELFIASVTLFFLAHHLLFRLHLPGRYTHHTLRIIIALIDGITIAIVFDKVATWLQTKLDNKLIERATLKFLLLIPLLCALLYPTYAVQSHPERLGYVTGNSPQLYQFLKQQTPTNTAIATLSEEADFIPSLAARSVLFSREYAIAYHRGYYNRIQKRVKALITAQYSLEADVLKEFIQKYQPEFILIDNDAFTTEYLTNNLWLQQFQPETTTAIEILQNQQKSVLETLSDRCTVTKTENNKLLETSCLLKTN